VQRRGTARRGFPGVAAAVFQVRVYKKHGGG